MKYSRRMWACPFFQWDDKLVVRCEAGKIAFPDRASIEAYAEKYCGSVEQWQGCSLAAALVAHYEREKSSKSGA